MSALTSKSFLVGQNEPATLARQAAARAWYNEGVKWSRARVMGVVLLPMCLGVINTVWAIALPSLAPTVLVQSRVWAAATALLLAAADHWWLRPALENARRAAAVAQEMFDTDVLDLPWNQLLVGVPHVIADIDKRSSRIRAADRELQTLKQWYPHELAHLPLLLGRVMAQRMNVWWDRSLREEYIGPLKVTIAAVLTVAVLVPLVTGRPLAEAVLVLASLLPGVRIWTEELKSHQKTSERHQSILLHANRVRDEIVTGHMLSAQARRECRGIQDAIFQQRATAPLGLPKLYWRSRDQNETAYRQEILQLCESLR